MADLGQVKVVRATPLPATAVQALYHAATGKTENLHKLLRGNYIIRRPDLDQLNFKILQQIEHYNVVGGPTTTVSVTFENHEHQQFSYWKRFSILDIGKSEIVKNFTYKIEFIIKIPEINELPDLKTIQRYIIDVDIDSYLRTKQEKSWSRSRNLEFVTEDFPPFSVSIDFIDYVVAKNFLRTVEEWFDGLEVASNPKWLLNIGRFLLIRPAFFIQAGYIGAALFISSYVYIHGAISKSSENYYLVSIVLIFFVITSFSCRELFEYYCRSIVDCIVPPSIILTKGDERAFAVVKKSSSSVSPTLMKFSGGITFSLALNVFASFLYAWLTR